MSSIPHTHQTPKSHQPYPTQQTHPPLTTHDIGWLLQAPSCPRCVPRWPCCVRRWGCSWGRPSRTARLQWRGCTSSEGGGGGGALVRGWVLCGPLAAEKEGTTLPCTTLSKPPQRAMHPQPVPLPSSPAACCALGGASGSKQRRLQPRRQQQRQQRRTRRRWRTCSKQQQMPRWGRLHRPGGMRGVCGW
jgi:hypothetical protein